MHDIKTFPLAAGVVVCLAAFLTGCGGNRYVQGVDVSLGLSVPGTDGAAQVSVLEYISGIKVVTRTNMPFGVTFKEWTTNDYLGVIHIREHRETDVDVH